MKISCSVKFSAPGLVLTVLVAAFLVIAGAGCKKTRDMEAVITVKYAMDTSRTVSGADVVFSMNDMHFTGKTDATGRYTRVFDLEMVLGVVATKDTGTGTLKDSTIIRLAPEKTVYRTLYIGQ